MKKVFLIISLVCFILTPLLAISGEVVAVKGKAENGFLQGLETK